MKWLAHTMLGGGPLMQDDKYEGEPLARI
jgi:hypothetical protein